MDTSWRPHRLMILGAGVTGSAIAALALSRGMPVVLVDPDEDALSRARRTVPRRALGQARSDRLGGAVGELTLCASVPDGRAATAVVEAVTERAVVKAKALSAACSVVAPGTPLISTTAAIPIDELAEWAGRPHDMLGAQFGHPGQRGRLVEVVLGKRTADEAADAALDLLAALGRSVVMVSDTPGFVSARLLHPLINDAARGVAEGVASVQEVDALMRCRLDQPAGPFRLADQIGLDTLVDSLTAMYDRTGDERFRPCRLLIDKVRTGELGRKTGRGFYADYADCED